MLFNISNRHINLQPVLGDIAEALGLVALVREDDEVSEAEAEARKSESDWLILARRREDLAGLDDDFADFMPYAARACLLIVRRLTYADAAGRVI